MGMSMDWQTPPSQEKGASARSGMGMSMDWQTPPSQEKGASVRSGVSMDGQTLSALSSAARLSGMAA